MKTVIKTLIFISFVSNLTSHNITTNEASREAQIFRILNLDRSLYMNFVSSKPVELLKTKKNKRADNFQNEIIINQGNIFSKIFS